jgi:hypothetical protein
MLRQIDAFVTDLASVIILEKHSQNFEVAVVVPAIPIGLHPAVVAIVNDYTQIFLRGRHQLSR